LVLHLESASDCLDEFVAAAIRPSAGVTTFFGSGGFLGGLAFLLAFDEVGVGW